MILQILAVADIGNYGPYGAIVALVSAGLFINERRSIKFIDLSNSQARTNEIAAKAANAAASAAENLSVRAGYRIEILEAEVAALRAEIVRLHKVIDPNATNGWLLPPTPVKPTP